MPGLGPLHPILNLDQSPPPDWKGGADALAAWAERLGCPSWGGWVNKEYGPAGRGRLGEGLMARGQ